MPLIIAHRGASAVAPENTMVAFRKAIAAGSDGVEFDVRLTRDGVPVIIHDNSLNRTAGLPHRIADLTRSELELLDERVPSLEELFSLFASNDLLLFLELKYDSPAEHGPLADACCKFIAEYSLKQRVFIECFDLRALELVKQIDSQIKTAPLFHASARNLSDDQLVDMAGAIEASAIALHYNLVRASLIQKARDAGLRTAVWTVDDPLWVESAKSMSIDALITNNPAAMLAHR